MKKVVSLFIAALMISSCSEAQQKRVSGSAQTAETFVRVVVAEEFKQIMKKEDVQLIDVRTQREFANGHIVNAENLDFYSDDFRAMLAKLDKNKITLVYCHSGGRSAKASKLMADMGFINIADLKGGYSAWPY